VARLARNHEDLPRSKPLHIFVQGNPVRQGRTLLNKVGFTQVKRCNTVSLDISSGWGKKRKNLLWWWYLNGGEITKKNSLWQAKNFLFDKRRGFCRR
jgi:hypothetical protein